MSCILAVAPVQKTILSSQSYPGVRGPSTPVGLTSDPVTMSTSLNPVTQMEHIKPHPLPLGCPVSVGSNSLPSTGKNHTNMYTHAFFIVLLGLFGSIIDWLLCLKWHSLWLMDIRALHQCGTCTRGELRVMKSCYRFHSIICHGRVSFRHHRYCSYF